MKITEIKPILLDAKEVDDNVLMVGRHGIGKSEIVKQYAKENGFEVVILMLSLMDTGDLLGLPDARGDKTIWLQPDWLQELKEAVMPEEMELEELEFNDKEFEEFIKAKLGA